MSKIRVIYLPVGETSNVIEVENTLKALQDCVDGKIETVTFKDYIVICDEEGQMKGKEKNRKINGVTFYGDILLINSDEEGAFKSIDDKSIEILLEKFSNSETVRDFFKAIDEAIAEVISEYRQISKISAYNCIYEVMFKKQMLLELDSHNFAIGSLSNKNLIRLLDKMYWSYIKEEELSIEIICERLAQFLENNSIEDYLE